MDKARSRRITNIVSEDDLDTFESWLTYQGFPASSQLSPADLKTWRDMFEEGQKRAQATPKVGRMRLPPFVANEFRYAVAVRDAGVLWLALWVRRSRKGELFVLIPRGESGWDPHASYHLDGAVHSKSFGRKFPSQPRQPLTGTFCGTEHFGMYAGFGPKGVGAICDRAAFTKVIEVGPDVLGPRHGVVIVDLIAPGCTPITTAYKIIAQETLKDAEPWVVVTVGTDPS